MLRDPEVIATSDGRRPNPLGAVVIGTAVALAAGAAITALGVAIVAGTVDAVARDMPDGSSFALAGGTWVTVAQVVTVAAGAFVAGRLAYADIRDRGGFYGLGVWAFTVVVSVHGELRDECLIETFFTSL